MLTRMKGLLQQEDGASLLEYSVLIGIVLVSQWLHCRALAAGSILNGRI